MDNSFILVRQSTWHTNWNECLMLQLDSSVIWRHLTVACCVCYILIFTGLTLHSKCMRVHRCMQNKAPQYLKEYCISFSDSDNRQHLRSASCHLLSVPRHRRTFGHRAFAAAGLTAWNSLPHNLHDLSCCNSHFGRFLKSILFSFY